MLIQANALHIPLRDASVQCCVTSPPYWGLRDYGVTGQLGLERTPEAYVDKMVECFREVRRVLREDGTLWLNMGDTYLAGKPRNQEVCESGGMRWSNEQSRTRGNGAGQRIGHRSSFRRDRMERQDHPHKSAPALKPKDLVGIPWLLAFALRADGWYLRSEITLCKRNPMPESVTDRPTSATEKLFLLTKSARYFYDSDAVREAYLPQSVVRSQYASQHTGPRKTLHFPEHSDKRDPSAPDGIPCNPHGRNLRNWWEYVSTPFPDAHFATFSPELPKRCILAGTSERGACAKCGAPWERMTDREFVPQQDVSRERGVRGAAGQKPMDASNGLEGFPRGTTTHTTIGWRPACACNAPTVPCVVLDPFGGSMTTVAVAEGLGRRGIGMDLKPEYLAMGVKRVRHTNRGLPLFSP